jgi:hypothetical protein
MFHGTVEPHLFVTSPTTGDWWPVCQLAGCGLPREEHPSVFELDLHRRVEALEQQSN